MYLEDAPSVTRPAFSTTAGSRLGPWEISYIPVAGVAELAAGALKEVDLGRPQVLLAFVDSKYFAFTRQCPHARGSKNEY